MGDQYKKRKKSQVYLHTQNKPHLISKTMVMYQVCNKMKDTNQIISRKTGQTTQNTQSQMVKNTSSTSISSLADKIFPDHKFLITEMMTTANTAEFFNRIAPNARDHKMMTMANTAEFVNPKCLLTIRK